MDALIAIALLCQVTGGKPHKAEMAQLNCQKYYIDCLETGIKDDAKAWVGALKQCVLKKNERPVRAKRPKKPLTK